MDIKNTIKFVQEVHGNQLYGDMPYIVHLNAVARHFTDPKMQITAFLHDVLEDTPINESFIKAEWGNAIADAVEAITRRNQEPYLKDYLPRVKRNEMARLVKIADLEENIFNAQHVYPEYGSLIHRYGIALEMLR